MSAKVKLTGLWKKKTKKGETYLDARLGGSYIQIFPNSFKKKETDPDFMMYLSEPIRREANPLATDALDSAVTDLNITSEGANV